MRISTTILQVCKPQIYGRFCRQKKLSFKVLGLFFLMIAGADNKSTAQINLSTSPYTQDFNTLANINTSSVVPLGWMFNESGSNANLIYSASNGSASAGDTYSFGPTGSSERAFGGVLSGSLTPLIGAGFKNTTGTVITSITITYMGEQWRLGSISDDDRLDFQYSFNATSILSGTWTDKNELDFTSPVITPVGSLDGNLGANKTLKTFTFTGLTFANNATLYIRWSDFNVLNSDDGLAIDDFSLSFTTLAQPTVNAGIFESFVIMNFGGSDVFYDLNAATSNTDFNGVNFGTYSSSQALYLDGAQNKTYKCSPFDITNGKLFYRIYSTSGTPGSFSAGTILPFLSNDAGAGAGCQNQAWQEAAAGINLLSGLCDGNYTIEVFTSADYQGSGTGTLFANNAGANYKASFTVKNDDRSGIYQSQLVLKLNGGVDTYYDLLASTPGFDFAGSLGTFCNNGSLVIAGAENKTFKCSPNDITATALYYRIYSGTATGSFVPVNVGFVTDDGASVCGGLNQIWRTTNNTTNILTGLPAGTYTLEVYTQANYTSNGICPGISFANNGGANYKATFTVVAPVTFTTTPAFTLNRTAGTGICSTSATYSFVVAGSSPVLNYTFSGATTGSGSGTGSNSTFNVGTTLVTVTGSNTCSPDATYNFNVVVADATPPTVLTNNVTVFLDATGNASVTAAQINNGSSDACGISNMTVSPGSFNCGNLRTTSADLFISEYVEGTGTIKALELYNGTSNTINLASGNYVVRFYFNGSADVGASIALSGSIAPGETFVLANNTGILGGDQYSGVGFYNGNDAVALAKNSVNIDIIGQIGFDPGTEWGSGQISTEGNTMRRKPFVSYGDNNGGDAFIPATEWDGFALDNVSGLGSHTYTGSNLVTLTVTDNNNNSATRSSLVIVKDDIAPVAPTLTPITGECTVTVVAPTALDNCTFDVTGTTNDPVTFNAQGTYTINWKFTDASGNFSTAMQTVIVDDITAPLAPTLTTVTGECSASVTAPTATDNCVGTITGTTTDPTTYTAQGTYTVNWSFNDGNGNTSTTTQTVIVDDITAPVAPALNTVTGECSASVTAPKAVDNCEGNVTGITSDATSYTTQGTYLINWSFNDGNGNTSTAVQTVIVDDITAPVAPTLNTVSGECGASVTAPIAVDNCVGTITGTTTDPTTYTAQGTYTVNWSFNDGNGNVSTANQTVVLDDITAPVAPTLSTVTGECSASVTAPTATDNCVGNITGTTSSPLSYTAQGTYTIVWSFNDGNGNVSTANQTVVVDDITAPVAPTLSTVTGECAASVTAPTAVDNCAGNVTGITTDPTSFTTQGTYIINWSFNDGNGNTSTAVQTVIVKDVTAPTIVCPANIVLTACQPTASWAAPQATDNCSGLVVSQTGGATSGSTFAPGTTTTISYRATDAGGNIANCSFSVTRMAELIATCSANNPVLYYGYAGDQAAVVSVAISGGTAPYTVVATMNRPLNCNMVTLAGDELWVPGAGTLASANTNTICPASGSGLIPSSTGNVSAVYGVSVTLMANAVITFTITDANGCVITCSKTIQASDVRCFAGNSAIAKITVCHQTGSLKNPCVKICIDPGALDEHLAHGDFVGACTTDCVAPAGLVAGQPIPALVASEDLASILSAQVSPNPTSSYFNIVIKGKKELPVTVKVRDIFGRLLQANENIAANSTLKYGHNWAGGTYFVEVMQGKERIVLRVIKGN
jgi:HYR domain/Lamin Tail Domain/Secretion system C-terminal sorting domain